MKNTTRMLCAAALLGLGGAAQADFYISGGLYSSAVDVTIAANTETETATAPALFLGWRPLELVGAEVGYYDLGSYDIQGVSIDASAYTAAGLLSLELGPVGVYAKGGLASSTVDVSSSGVSASDSSTDPFGGVGLTVDVMDKLYVYAEFLRFTNDANVDIDVVGAGLRYAF